ncbi:hypothetical protein [Carboxydocella sp. JDF658]|uniref:YkvI family membrane protein n=1 Tax=Carboxydocella sp. JDF658 TaxID=1926600 RepID=UPI0009AD0325|nr:hypothetical protein [Carboxydocella sp. JDF658]GAW31124.1 Uncharacterized membrane protein YkvI [Carboxydocella sp. JDF658]
MVKKENFSAWQIAATYIGTMVGAGFASGQETLQFFSSYGTQGLWGILLATFGFGFFGMLVMRFAWQINASSHAALFRLLFGPLLGSFLDWLLNAFLFSTLLIMLAASGAVFEEHLGLSRWWGILLAALLALLVLFFGVRGILAANAWLVPLLILMVLGISLYSLFYHGLSWEVMAQPPASPGVAPHWLLASLLYLSYNLILSATILAPLGGQSQKSSPLYLGAWLGALGIGLLTVLIALVVLVHFPQILDFEIPILYIVKPHPFFIRLIVILVLWTEIFTTMIANLFGLAVRLQDKWGKPPLFWSFILLAAAILFSHYPFSLLVETLYPLLGYAGLAFLLALSYHFLKN